ncbi:hypothetical protein G6F47_006238 [Rhizopus delemar]|nr:hypothetical protein G6F54_004052 [Rhizopus delemar]KAG1513717.1 hypothetical protein G6F53_004224 [Rhizopus delemar]KAG1598638.1 hypothetical protein G6F47_006238 [Rhizopus delemar]
MVDTTKEVVLRWPNKEDALTADIRPDAIVSTLVQRTFGQSLGFGISQAWRCCRHQPFPLLGHTQARRLVAQQHLKAWSPYSHVSSQWMPN